MNNKFDLSKSVAAAPVAATTTNKEGGAIPGVAGAATAPTQVPAVAPTILPGSQLKLGSFIELAGVAIYEVTKLPTLIERKDKEAVEIPGSASLVVGNCTQRMIELWPTRNYHTATYTPAGTTKRVPVVQKGATSTDNMTTSQPQQ